MTRGADRSKWQKFRIERRLSSPGRFRDAGRARFEVRVGGPEDVADALEHAGVPRGGALLVVERRGVPAERDPGIGAAPAPPREVGVVEPDARLAPGHVRLDRLVYELLVPLSGVTSVGALRRVAVGRLDCARLTTTMGTGRRPRGSRPPTPLTCTM